MLIPFASRQYGEHQQRKLLKSWESVAPQNDSPVDVAMSELPVIEDEPVPLSAPELAENAADDLMRSGSAIGVLIIEDLEMRLPIIEDSTMQNLAVAPCHVQGTGLPGEYDNFVIAGHRSKTPGKNFNRLDELNIGDQACFVTQKGTFYYEATGKRVVKPTAVEVLEGHGYKEMTLLTCHPMDHPTGRLIVTLKQLE